MPYIDNGKHDYDDAPLTHDEKQLRVDTLAVRWDRAARQEARARLRKTSRGEGSVNEDELDEVARAKRMVDAHRRYDIKLTTQELDYYFAIIDGDYERRVRESHDFLDKVLRAEQRGEIEEEPIDTRIEHEHVSLRQRLARKLQTLVDALAGEVP